MARKQKLTLDVAIRTAIQSNSQRQLAKKLGVSPRTVGRWLHGESKPRDSGKVMRQLSPIYYHTKRVIEKGNATYTGDDAISPPRTAIPLAGDRKEIAVRDGFGKPIKGADGKPRKRLSDWVNYDVSALDYASIMDALRDIRDRAPARGTTIQVVYRVRAKHFSPYRRQKIDSADNEATKLKLIRSDMSDGDLWSFVLAPLAAANARVLFLAVVER